MARNKNKLDKRYHKSISVAVKGKTLEQLYELLEKDSKIVKGQVVFLTDEDITKIKDQIVKLQEKAIS